MSDDLFDSSYHSLEASALTNNFSTNLEKLDISADIIWIYNHYVDIVENVLSQNQNHFSSELAQRLSSWIYDDYCHYRHSFDDLNLDLVHRYSSDFFEVCLRYIQPETDKKYGLKFIDTHRQALLDFSSLNSLAKKHQANLLTLLSDQGNSLKTKFLTFLSKNSEVNARKMLQGYSTSGLQISKHETGITKYRIYINGTPRAHAKILSTLLKYFNDIDGINGLKAAFPGAKLRGRSDSLVLYMQNQNATNNLLKVLARSFLPTEKWLENLSPIFTKKFSPGVSYGEAPKNGMSFGGVRANALVAAFKRSHAQNKLDCSATYLENVESAFRKYRVDPNKAWKNIP